MSKPGPKPGSRHSGMFQVGHDPRRQTAAKYAKGKAFREACRAKSPEAMDLIYNTMNDDDQPMPFRLQCARYIIEQGHGKPLPADAIQETEDFSKMTASELDAAISRYLQHDVIEGVVVNEEENGQ